MEVGGRKAKQKCSPCVKKNKNTLADKYCKECRQFQCKECSQCHEIFDFMSGHELVPAQEVVSVPVKVDMKGLDICKDHKDKFKYVCVDHDKLCCSDCAILVHKNCPEVNRLSVEVGKGKVRIADVVSVVRGLEKGAHDLLRELNETIKGLANQMEPMLKLIDETKHKLMLRFDELKTYVTVTFDKVKHKTTAYIGASISKVEQNLEKLKTSSTFLSSVADHNTEEEKYIAARFVGEEIIRCKATLEKQTHAMYKTEVSIKLSDFLKGALSNQRLATVFVDKVFINSNPIEKGRVAVFEQVTSMNLTQLGENASKPFYTGMDFFPDGRLVVIDNKNKAFIILDCNLKKVGMYGLLKNCLSVTVVSEEMAVVTCEDENAVYVFRVSKTNDISLTSSFKTTAKYDSVSTMNDTTLLVSTVGDKRPLRMVMLTGGEKDFANLPDNIFQHDESRAAYVPNKGLIALTDRYNQTVYLYENIDECLMTRIVVKDKRIREPTGVCPGPDDTLFVCCMDTGSVVQISASGRVLGSHKLDMEYPHLVCMAKDGKRIAVSNSACSDGKLQLLNVQ